MACTPDRRSAATSLRFAVPLRWPVQGSPSLANPFSGAKVHRTFAFIRFTLRHHPGSLMQYAGYCRSAARMMALMEIFQAFPRHVGINLGSRNIAVTQQHLHHAKIGAVVQ